MRRPIQRLCLFAVNGGLPSSTRPRTAGAREGVIERCTEKVVETHLTPGRPRLRASAILALQGEFIARTIPNSEGRHGTVREEAMGSRCKLTLSLLILGLHCACVAVANSSQRGLPYLPGAVLEAEEYQDCGVVALYAALRASGLSVTWSEVSNACPLGPCGVTMDVVERAARGLGASTLVVGLGTREIEGLAHAAVVFTPDIKTGCGHYLAMWPVRGDVLRMLDVKSGVVDIKRELARSEKTMRDATFLLLSRRRMLAPLQVRAITLVCGLAVGAGLGFVCRAVGRRSEIC